MAAVSKVRKGEGPCFTIFLAAASFSEAKTVRLRQREEALTMPSGCTIKILGKFKAYRHICNNSHTSAYSGFGEKRSPKTPCFCLVAHGFFGLFVRQGKVEVAAEQADNLRYEEERQWIRRQW